MPTKLNIVRGGKAINIDKRLYYIDGKPHELGGVDIGRNLEVEGGEVVEVKNKGLRVYSAQPILNGNSPAELVMNGIEPNTVFNAQEKFKDINGLNDDGTKKKRIGGEEQKTDNTYVNRTEYISPIERTVNGKKWSELTPEEQFKNRNGYINGRPIETGLVSVNPEFDILSGIKLVGKTAANIGRNIGETLISYASPEVSTALSLIPGGNSIKINNIKTPTINAKNINKKNVTHLLEGNIETPRLSLTDRTVDDFKEPIALLESPEVMTRNELKKVNAWAKLWGYDPIPLSKAKYRPNADRAVQDLINQHNTFVRGVRQPNYEQKQQIIKGLKKEGKEINDYNILEYAATHAAGKTGAGRANLNTYLNGDIGTIYTSNIGRTAAGYSDLGASGFGEIPGIPFIVKRPTNFKGSRYSDWIIDNDFNLNNEKSFYHRKVVSDEIARTGKSPDFNLTNDDIKKINNKINDSFYDKDINKQIDTYLRLYKKNNTNVPHNINSNALKYMNKEDKQIYLDYLKTLSNNSKVNFYDFAKKHRAYRKEELNKIIKHYNKTVRDEKIKNYAEQKGYKFNNKDLTNIDSERLSYSTRNTGNAGQHFIFKGKIGDKILESQGPYIPTNEDFINSTRTHEFYYTPGFSRRSRKLGGNYKEIKRMGGNIRINGNVIDKLLFASPSTGDKKKAVLGTGTPGKNYPIIYRDSIVPPVYGMPSIAAVRRLTYPNSDVLKITENPAYNNVSSNYPSINIKTPKIKYYSPLSVKRNNSIDNSIEGVDYNQYIYPNVTKLNKIETSPSNESIINKTLSSSPNDDPSNLKVDTSPYAPYQWDDTQFNITPGSISKAETNRSLRGPLGDTGGYDPIEEGILQIKEVGTGKSGTPNNFTWRSYTDPSSDNSIVNRVPRSINAEEELNKWGFNPNRIYIRNNNQGNQTEVEQTNSSSNSSITIPRRGYSKSTFSKAVTPRTMKTTVDETPIDISISPSITLPVPNISQKAINDTINNGLKTQNDLYRGSFDDITPEDWIGAGSNLAASVASYFTGLRRPSIDLVEPSKPVMEQAARFVTKYNNRPEVSNIRENVRRSIDDISANTSSSRAALQRMQRVRNAGTQSINESEAKKQNIETQLKNADAANRQDVRARNVTRYNNWLDDLQNVRNKQRIINAERSTGKLQNTIGLFNNVNATLQDLLSRIEQRRRFNNTLSYLQSTAPNVDDRIMRDNGVNFDYLRTVGG